MTSPGDCGADIPTCDDYYFRHELLCALAGNTICPTSTFRAAEQAPPLYAVLAEPEPERRPVAA